jgi:hypothetical protein
MTTLFSHLIEQGLVDGLQVLARPAEVVEVLYSDEPTPTGQEPGGGDTCESCMATKPNGAFTTVLKAPPNGPIICDACLDTLPMDLLLATRRLNELSALPAAPAANPIEARTPDSFSGPSDSTATGREEPPPAYCPDLAACEASNCPACATPAGPYRCPLCETNDHYATQCPQVALMKYAIGVWDSYMEDRAAFLKLIQWGSAQRLALMGDAVAAYLSARWGGPITGYQVLAGWGREIAASAS